MDPSLDPGALRDDLRHAFANQKGLADRALAQVDDGAFLAPLSGEVDPLAVVVKHVGGNLRSRWREFLTTDGEKPDRHRDLEFVLEPGEDRAAVMARWESGWSELFGALDSLEQGDWATPITIRGEEHSVAQAALRSLAHTSYHVGQIVRLARRAAGGNWMTLSIARGGSEEFRAEPTSYLRPPE